jgi:hypothetical protein
LGGPGYQPHSNEHTTRVDFTSLDPTTNYASYGPPPAQFACTTVYDDLPPPAAVSNHLFFLLSLVLRKLKRLLLNRTLSHSTLAHAKGTKLVVWAALPIFHNTFLLYGVHLGSSITALWVLCALLPTSPRHACQCSLSDLAYNHRRCPTMVFSVAHLRVVRLLVTWQDPLKEVPALYSTLGCQPLKTSNASRANISIVLAHMSTSFA